MPLETWRGSRSAVSASLRDRCSALFRAHQVEAFGGTFHVPDRDTYPALFAWDSGYHALSLLHLDPGIALEELRTLYRANRLADGLLSHQRFVPGAEEHQRFIEDLFGPMFDGDRTPFVDPPAAACTRRPASRWPSERPPTSCWTRPSPICARWPAAGRWADVRCRPCSTRSRRGPRGAR